MVDGRLKSGQVNDLNREMCVMMITMLTLNNLTVYIRTKIV